MHVKTEKTPQRLPKKWMAVVTAAVLLFAAVMYLIPEESRPAWVNEWLSASTSSADLSAGGQLEV